MLAKIDTIHVLSLVLIRVTVCPTTFNVISLIKHIGCLTKFKLSGKMAFMGNVQSFAPMLPNNPYSAGLDYLFCHCYRMPS